MSEAAPCIYSVLFLCTGNSARSILAEAALERVGSPRFRAFSAGSDPKGRPHPAALITLERLGYETEGLRSKSWDEFARPDGPPIDLILTVCDNAAGEACPVWPGRPITAHWGVEDPADFVGSSRDEQALFERIHDELLAKVEALVALDAAALSRGEFAARLQRIGSGL
ncbi:MAG: arsenate reductase ArsC [bacterium]|nr:hypothetical protein [Deltaproteobacteria bacterium]MCP4904933.1 arsenate reductase ArsC [bacterium]